MLRTSFSLQRHRRCSSLCSTRVIPQGYRRGETHFKIQLPVPINSKMYSLFPQHFLFPTSADMGREGKEDQAKLCGGGRGHARSSSLTSGAQPCHTVQWPRNGKTSLKQEWFLSHISEDSLKSFIITYLWIDIMALKFWRELRYYTPLCLLWAWHVWSS